MHSIQPVPPRLYRSIADRLLPAHNLRRFERLEELMLDCRSIYEDGELDDSDRLVSLLPPSIRSFRIAYVFMGLKRSLTGLVLEAPRRFPDLKRVEIGIAQGIRPEHRDEIEQTKTVDTLFAATGIELVWTVDPLGSHGRTIIPGAFNWSELIPLATLKELE